MARVDWLPKSVSSLQEYDRPTLFSDLIAGITVGLVSLPLAMAFAIASGVPPKAGIYCAVVIGFLIALFGGSKTQVSGPPSIQAALARASQLYGRRKQKRTEEEY